jgi:hypothetical protein
MAQESDISGSGLDSISMAESALVGNDAEAAGTSPPAFRARLSAGSPQSPSAPAESNKGILALYLKHLVVIVERFLYYR